MPSRLEDYALLGDSQTAALVSLSGSIDWLCLPRFDSDACFAAMLGDPKHGRWLIAPTGGVKKTTRAYRAGTLILETTFSTADGDVMIVDFMPPRDVTPDLVRIVRGVSGRVPIHFELTPRFEYGRILPWIQRDSILRAVAGPAALTLHTETPIRAERDGFRADFTVGRGDELAFTLTCGRSYEAPPPKRDPQTAERHTEEWWRAWTSRTRYEGEWRDAVCGSLTVLKALTYLPTGGIVAAPTTSLPEQLGGVRNWDYRYCWLRDATFTLYALMSAGYQDEARAWRDWLLRAVAGAPEQMQIMYAVDGARRLPEITLDWLPGYERSAPVRVGNAAVTQLQLDVYGEVMDCLHASERAGAPLEESAWELQKRLVDHLERAWREKDEGIWEVRGAKRHFTHSKVMAWVAMDRAVKSVECFELRGPIDEWRKTRAEIHAEVCEKGFSRARNAFVQAYGAADLDASLLMIPLVGFLPPHDPRVIGTVTAVERELTDHGFVRRYVSRDVDGLPPGEGAFLPCTFWLADNLALQGRHAEARAIFARLLALRNDVGLLSEEYDVGARRLCGNFPQAFTHVSLVNSARNLSRLRGGPAEHRAGGDFL
jgi:GH15 family glucan-1,4-alpha-glucosidase